MKVRRLSSFFSTTTPTPSRRRVVILFPRRRKGFNFDDESMFFSTTSDTSCNMSVRRAGIAIYVNRRLHCCHLSGLAIFNNVTSPLQLFYIARYNPLRTAQRQQLTNYYWLVWWLILELRGEAHHAELNRPEKRFHCWQRLQLLCGACDQSSRMNDQSRCSRATRQRRREWVGTIVRYRQGTSLADCHSPMSATAVATCPLKHNLTNDYAEVIGLPSWLPVRFQLVAITRLAVPSFNVSTSTADLFPVSAVKI